MSDYEYICIIGVRKGMDSLLKDQFIIAYSKMHFFTLLRMYGTNGKGNGLGCIIPSSSSKMGSEKWRGHLHEFLLDWYSLGFMFGVGDLEIGTCSALLWGMREVATLFTLVGAGV